MPISEAEAKFVLETREYFSNIDLWPERPRHVDPDGWLENFDPGDDRRLATSLLDSFLLVGTKHCEAMVTSAFHALSARRADVFANPTAAYQDAWRDFLANVLITYPSRRNDSGASGHIFSRLARDWVLDEESQVLDPGIAVEQIATSASPKMLVFIDDFSGSGNQFCDTWIRRFSIGSGGQTSFDQLAEEGRMAEIYFVPAICTWRAKALITQVTRRRVDVMPAHILPPRYSAADSEHQLVPAEDRDALDDLLRRYADRAGYAEENRFGYEDCGLAVSFEHATPDNALPIFNGGTQRPETWRPLRSR